MLVTIIRLDFICSELVCCFGIAVHVLVCDIESVCVFSFCLFNDDNLYVTFVFMPVHFRCDYIKYTCYSAHNLPASSSLVSTLVKVRELRTSEEIGDVYDC